MKKFMSSVAVLAVAFSMSAHAAKEMETRKVEGLDSPNTTIKSLGDTGINLLLNSGNLVIALNNNIEAIPGGMKDKSDKLKQCIDENLEKFKDYRGNEGTTYAMCSLGAGVDAIGLVIQKTTGVAFRITAVPGKLLSDAGRSMLADVDVLVDSMNDKNMTKVPGLWALNLGYVIGAGAVGVAGMITGDMIQFISTHGQHGVELAINRVLTGIKVAHEKAVIIVHYAIEAGEEVGKRVVLVVGDVLQSAVDGVATTNCGFASIFESATNGVLDVFRSQDTIDKRSRARGNACDMDRNLAKDAGHIVLKVVTLSIRMFTNESYEEFMEKGGTNDFVFTNRDGSKSKYFPKSK